MSKTYLYCKHIFLCTSYIYFRPITKYIACTQPCNIYKYANLKQRYRISHLFLFNVKFVVKGIKTFAMLSSACRSYVLYITWCFFTVLFRTIICIYSFGNSLFTCAFTFLTNHVKVTLSRDFRKFFMYNSDYSHTWLLIFLTNIRGLNNKSMNNQYLFKMTENYPLSWSIWDTCKRHEHANPEFMLLQDNAPV